MIVRKRYISCFITVMIIGLLCGCGSDPYNCVPTEVPLFHDDGLVSTESTNEIAEIIGKEIISEDITQTTHTTQTEEEPEIITISINAAGDVTLGNTAQQSYSGSFRQMYDEQNPEYFFQNVKSIFEEDDLTIVNFEGVLTYSEDIVEKEYNMKGNPDYIDILTKGSVEAVSFGNNHRMDYSKQGSDDTVTCFQEANIAYAYDDITGIYETKGIKIGIVSVNQVYDGAAVDKYVENGVESLKKECDLIIVCCHWGIERENYPTDYQTSLGKKAIDWGADLVLGSHPHVLQGVEVYKNKFIVYSLSNFCFGGNRNPQDKDSMIFNQTFTFIDGEKQNDLRAQVIPCSVSSVKNRNDFCPTPAVGTEYERILERINEYSSPYQVTFDEEGCYLLNTKTK